MAQQRTARDLARERITSDIIDEARRQLAEHGAAGLSLRSVAREVGMVSSAVYRYVASRDELLTRLIIEGYDSLGEAAEGAVERSAGGAPSDRWVLTAQAIRDWALARPHEYALLYGTPVPGYAAPSITSGPGVRPSLALLRIVADAQASKQLRRRRSAAAFVVAEPLVRDFAELRTNVAENSGVDLDIDDATMLDVLVAWTQLFGLLSFELTNQTRGIVAHHEDMFAAAARRMAGHIGLL